MLCELRGWTIFTPGLWSSATWPTREYGPDFTAALGRNFWTLRKFLVPTLRLGHDSEQRLATSMGFLALGTIAATVLLPDGRLVATAVGVPLEIGAVATVARTVGKALSVAGTMTAVGTVVKAVGKAIAGSVLASGVIAKAITKPLAGSVAPSGVVSPMRARAVAVGGVLTAAGSLAKAIGKLLTGAVQAVGSLVTSGGRPPVVPNRVEFPGSIVRRREFPGSIVRRREF